MKKRAWAVLFVILCFKNGFAASETAVQEVPFEPRGHFIVVKGSIGTLDNLNLVIDTGASLTTLSTVVAKKLGLKGLKLRVEATAGEVTVEQVEVPAVILGMVNLGKGPGYMARLSFPGRAGRSLRIDGLIGLNHLKRTGLTVDYESRILRFGPISTKQRAVPAFPIPFIFFYVQGYHLRLLVDTAAADLMLFESERTKGIAMTKKQGQKRTFGVGREATLEMIRLQNAALGDLSWSRLTAFVLKGRASPPGVDGILGPLALGCKRLHLDFANNAIVFE